MHLNISIINYFDKGLSWETFVAGFFVVNIFSVCVLFLMYLLPEFHKVDESFIDFYFRAIKDKMRKYFAASGQKNGSDIIANLIRITQIISLGSAVIVVSFIAGIIFSNLSDSFMDHNNYVHLGLKKSWTNLNAEKNLCDTDEEIKIDVFNKIFGEKCLSERKIKKAFKELNRKSALKVEESISENTRHNIIKDVYYFSKHRILESKNWSGYVETTQTLINLNQTFCFGSWLLIITSFIGFSVTVIISIRDKIVNSQSHHSWSELIFLLLIVLIFLANIVIPADWAISTGKILMGLLVLIMFLSQFGRIHGFRLNTSLMIFIFSIFLYYSTAVAWNTCEVEGCSKVYGLFIYMEHDLNNISVDILKASLN